MKIQGIGQNVKGDMEDIQQSCGVSESKALPFAEKLRATLKEEEEMPRPQKTEHVEATIDQK